MKYKDFFEVPCGSYISARHPINLFHHVYSLPRPEDNRTHHYFVSDMGVVFRIVVDNETDEIVHIAND